MHVCRKDAAPLTARLIIRLIDFHHGLGKDFVYFVESRRIYIDNVYDNTYVSELSYVSLYSGVDKPLR